jgi:hypothetical protein
MYPQYNNRKLKLKIEKNLAEMLELHLAEKNHQDEAKV